MPSTISTAVTTRQKNERSERERRHYPIAFAITNAAVAASPPTITVCQALRKGRTVVNRPLMYPNIKSASTVTTTEPIKAEWTERKKKYGASGTRPPAIYERA